MTRRARLTHMWAHTLPFSADENTEGVITEEARVSLSLSLPAFVMRTLQGSSADSERFSPGAALICAERSALTAQREAWPGGRFRSSLAVPTWWWCTKGATPCPFEGGGRLTWYVAGPKPRPRAVVMLRGGCTWTRGASPVHPHLPLGSCLF